MRIRQVSVSGLFGIFDHEIPLNTEERITIIHGPNGYGKTIILRMLDGLFNGHYALFSSVPFSRFAVSFEDGSRLEVTPVREQPESEPKLTGTLYRLGQEPLSARLGARSMGMRAREREVLTYVIEHNLPVRRVSPRTWRDRTGDLLSFEELIDRYGEQISAYLPLEARHGISVEKEPEWMQDLRATLNVRLIQTQRLNALGSAESPAPDRGERFVPTVKKYSDEIAAEMKRTFEEYGAKAQELDRTFPTRLFGQTKWRSLSAPDLRAKLLQLEDKRRELTKLGLLELEPGLAPAPEQAIEERLEVLTVYVGDVENKLQVFDELAHKIDAFTTIINSRFAYKKLRVVRSGGFVLESENGSALSPTDLSSGEQHELVLAYELLFKIAPNSLVLIDEPEISLHVEWQERFLGDLKRMVALSGVDVLIATHSPEIIGDNWPLTVRLKSPPEPKAQHTPPLSH